MNAAWTLARRELKRFFRQRNRVIGALAQPVIFWVLFSAAYKGSLRIEGGEQANQFFLPGIAMMIVLFTAIFSTISIIEDRNRGFLQGVLVAPVPRSAMVLGKILGGTLIAVVQGLLFLVLAPLVGVPLSVLAFVWALLVLFLSGLMLTAVGFVIAWRMDSVQGYHAIMSVVLFPLWLLSGAMFPVAGTEGWLHWLVRFNPMTYAVEALRHALWWGKPLTTGSPGMAVCIAVVAVFGVLMFALSVRLASRPARANWST